MSTDKRKPRNPAPAEPSYNETRGKRLLAEGALIGWIALCSILLLALLSYSSDDPGWSHTGVRGDLNNAVGLAGAWIADIFFALFGVMAFLFPALLAVRAIQILRTYILREADAFDSVTFTLRVIGFILVMISATSLANIQYAEVHNSYPFGVGGILGNKIGEATMAVFSYVGSTLILLS
ncbi:DNA translocase FtsK 4TM domain-containing protein, partial [Porticoccaceae bacterium]|nr:DNA translocase FtsK 4TM domain-containing protein [Porticoccaceae bacterium]